MADGNPRPRGGNTTVVEEQTITTELPGRAGAIEERSRQRTMRRPGQPFDRRNPFVAGFVATMGVLLAVALGAAIYSILATLVLVFLALFIAVGLEPAVAFFTRHRLRRSLAVLIVVLIGAGAVAGFVISAISPIEREINELIKQVPIWRGEIASGKGTVGHLAKQLHLSNYLGGKSTGSLAQDVATGALGAGEFLLGAVSDFLIVVVLTIYFLAALPAIKTFCSHLVPESRRRRFVLLSDEVLAGVGGYLLGNLFTSLVAGLGTFLWATLLGIPYPILLGLMVLFFDLIPVVGSTIAGVIVSLVALVISLPVAIATAAFYIAYRFVEDYLLVPRVMRHAVNVSPLLTVLAVIIGGALLGIVGALVAIPVAAGIKLIVEQTVFPRLDNS
ncbi:MAG TPA: AI-2E family transporter [Acidimicrobiales bacterium]|nr:AI-2E family transporter [Acidimicrobiales bacterium]